MTDNRIFKGLNGHPMLHKVLDAHLCGQSAREISSWINPFVSHATLSVYFAKHVHPVMGNAQAIKTLLGLNSDATPALAAALDGFTDAIQVDKLARHAVRAMPVLTLRDGRVKAQVDRHRRLSQLIEERAADMDGRGVPGGKTGLLVATSGTHGVDYNIDSTLLSELREHEKQIATELDQWRENACGGSVAVQISFAPGGGQPRVSFEAGRTIDIDSEDIAEEIGLVQ